MSDIELVIKIPEGLKKDFESEQWTALSCMEMKDALMNGTLLPKGHGRLIDADAVAEVLLKYAHSAEGKAFAEFLINQINDLPSVTPQPKTGHWIPVKWHEITDEEREREGYSKDWVCYLDSEMPYDGQRILVTTKGGYVELDECYSDDGQTFSLDSGYDWVDDIIAWMPLPEPYKAESDDVPDTNVGNIYVCPCGYGWDKSKVVRHHFCPNCGAKVVEGSEKE